MNRLAYYVDTIVLPMAVPLVCLFVCLFVCLLLNWKEFSFKIV